MAVSQTMPWNVIEFLDYAVDRGLLTKVETTYVFSHEIVQKHLADKESHSISGKNAWRTANGFFKRRKTGG